jgi:hypothetical protein
MLLGGDGQRLRPVVRDENAVALVLESGADGFGDRFLVVDDEDRLLGHLSIVSGRRGGLPEAVLRDHGGRAWRRPAGVRPAA